jgi:hypothetical protein
MGNSNIDFAKDRDIFYLEEVKFKSNSRTIIIHLEYIPMIIFQEKICYMGLIFMIIVIYRRIIYYPPLWTTWIVGKANVISPNKLFSKLNNFLKWKIQN